MEHSILPLMADARRQEELSRASRDWPSWTLTPPQLGDLELILNGAYAPLDRFMTRAEAESCGRGRRLHDGSAFPAPVLLAVSPSCADAAARSGRLVLRDQEGVGLAVLEVQESWRDATHFVAGPAIGLQLPRYADVLWARHTPAEVAREIARRAWTTATAYPTRGIIHRAEHEATAPATAAAQSGLVVMALTDPAEDEAKRLLRLQCLEAAVPEYAGRRALVWLVPLPRRESLVDDRLMATLVARNGGCTDVLVSDRLDPEQARIITEFTRRLGMRIAFAPVEQDDGARLPGVAKAMAVRRAAPPRRGFAVFLTGLSGSGKSTIANRLRAILVERTGRPVTMLDGDAVRQHLSSELGFSREHRDLNIRRIAFVAAEVARHGGMAICAAIAPYDAVRREARRAVEAVGGFVLVFVDTPLDVCEARDRKGLYAKARAGLIPEFTGVSDPYEPPADAEVVIRTSAESVEDAAMHILRCIEKRGYLDAEDR